MRQAVSRAAVWRHSVPAPLRRSSSLLAAAIAVACLSAMALSGCTPSGNFGDPALPTGFLNATIPDVELNAYIYVNAGRELALPIQAFGDAPGVADQQLGVRSIELVVNGAGKEFGVAVTFERSEDAESAAATVRQQAGAESSEGVDISSAMLTLARGQGDWPSQLSEAWAVGDRVQLEVKYPNMYVTMRLLPAQAPATPVAAGFVRNVSVLLEELLAQAGLSVSGVGAAFQLVRAESLAFVVYADDLDALPAEATVEAVKGASLGIIAVTRTTYPGVLVNMLLGTFAGRIGMELTKVGDESVRYRDIEGHAHLMAKNFGPSLFFALASTREDVETLMEAVIANQVRP